MDLLLMMATEIFDIDASWAEKLTKTESAILICANCSYPNVTYCDPTYRVTLYVPKMWITQ